MTNLKRAFLVSLVVLLALAVCSSVMGQRYTYEEQANLLSNYSVLLRTKGLTEHEADTIYKAIRSVEGETVEAGLHINQGRIDCHSHEWGDSEWYLIKPWSPFEYYGTVRRGNYIVFDNKALVDDEYKPVQVCSGCSMIRVKR